MNIQLKRLIDSVENHGARLSRNWQTKTPQGDTLHCFSVVRTSTESKAKTGIAVVIEYQDAGYCLLTDTRGGQITDDVETICGLGKGEGTLVT